MRTLVGAAEPEPEPPRITLTLQPATTSTTAVVWWAPPATTPREPYRTTVYPVPEIEE